MKVYDINPSKTVLLIIDAQREYFDSDQPLFTPNAATIRGNLLKLKKFAKKKGIRSIIIEHVQKADGSDIGRMGDFDSTPVFVEGTSGCETIPELLSPGDVLVRKNRYSAFVNTELEMKLRAWQIDTLIISGLMTNFCSVSTARHAHDLDFKVIFVTDANAGPDMPDVGFGPIPHSEIMRAIATSLASGVADLATTAEILK